MSNPPENNLTGAEAAPEEQKSQDELNFWLDRLKSDHSFLSRRNIRLFIFLTIGLLAFCLVIYTIHKNTIGQYAVLDNIRIEQHSASQGRISFTFDVKQPGKVYFQRESGPVEASRQDDFFNAQHVDRSWSWNYTPGKPIYVQVLSRRGLLPRFTKAKFPTSQIVDIVIIVDVTESMTDYIETLKKKCAQFASKLQAQTLQPRFALVGFADRAEGEWVTSFDFTDSVLQFQEELNQLRRFDGGDLPESALDALEMATAFSFEKGSIRRFYLITDADCHPETQSGLNSDAVYKLLSDKKVFLEVFSRPDFTDSYKPLIRDSGKYQEIENFGSVFSEGRILED